MQPEVIYKDADFAAISKPAGLLVHAYQGSDEPTLVDWALKNFPEIKGVGENPSRPGIVHRLDRGTSGIMLIARTQKGFKFLKSLFQNHEVRKTYLAMVRGVPKNKHDRILKPIGIGETLKRSVRSEKFKKTAATEYDVLKTIQVEGELYGFLSVRPLTGRTHQIRVHLASIGNPVLGDTLYGPKTQPAWVKRIMLHAFTLEFKTLQGAQIRLEAPPGKDFLGNLEAELSTVTP